MLQKIVANFVWSYDKLHNISLGVFITKKSNLKKLWKRTRGLTLVKMPLVIKGFERKGRVLLPKGGAAKKGEKVPPTVPQIGHFLIIQENRAEKRQSCRSRQNRTNWRTKVTLITRDRCLSKMLIHAISNFGRGKMHLFSESSSTLFISPPLQLARLRNCCIGCAPI